MNVSVDFKEYPCIHIVFYSTIKGITINYNFCLVTLTRKNCISRKIEAAYDFGRECWNSLYTQTKEDPYVFTKQYIIIQITVYAQVKGRRPKHPISCELTTCINQIVL